MGQHNATVVSALTLGLTLGFTLGYGYGSTQRDSREHLKVMVHMMIHIWFTLWFTSWFTLGSHWVHIRVNATVVSTFLRGSALECILLKGDGEWPWMLNPNSNPNPSVFCRRESPGMRSMRQFELEL